MPLVLLVLYESTAPASVPVTARVPTLLILSVLCPATPSVLSVVSATVGAVALVSNVKLSALEATLTLPAKSVWRA